MRSCASLLAAVLAAVPAAADAQVIDAGAMQAYTSALSNYTQALDRFRSSSEQPFGTYPLRVVCNNGDWYENNFPTDAMMGSLRSSIREVQGEVGQSGEDASGLSREWATQSKSVADQFAATEQAVSAAGQAADGGSRQAVLDSTGQLVARLDDAARQLGNWTQRLASSIQYIPFQTSSLRDSLARARDQVAQWVDETRRHAVEWTCRDGLEQQLNDFQGGFGSRMDEVERAFAPVESGGRGAAEATAGILGGVVSSRTAIAGIRDRVATLGGDQMSGFVQSLRLKTSANAWRAVADGAAGGRP